MSSRSLNRYIKAEKRKNSRSPAEHGGHIIQVCAYLCCNWVNTLTPGKRIMRNAEDRCGMRKIPEKEQYFYKINPKDSKANPNPDVNFNR